MCRLSLTIVIKHPLKYQVMKKLFLFIFGLLILPMLSSCGTSATPEEIAQLPVEKISKDEAKVLIDYVGDFTRQLQESVKDKNSKKLQNLLGQLADANTMAIISKTSQLSDAQVGEEGIKVREEFQETISNVLLFGINAEIPAEE